mmetsp:Transcript_107455/g.269550  ORF Transcript_107455/g.269550 Transcript_107455/m.269550 type:complete len:895 (+) Transcript_107455:103-2787(+)
MFAAEAPVGPEAALSQYSKRLGEAREAGKGERPTLSRCRFPQPSSRTAAEVASHEAVKIGALRAELASDNAAGQHVDNSTGVACGGSVVVDGETVLTCQQCQLPLGELVYLDRTGEEKLLHGECKARCMLHKLRTDEQERKHRELELKKVRREEFAIGWSPIGTIPRNAVCAGRLGCAVVPKGMCCLVNDKDSSTVSVAPTFEPAAAMNLEYLTVALQVRRTEGREPLFSLDPAENGKLDDKDPEASMLVKRFEPDWLAGTSVGEVMFQADYHLKELSFGEYDQPVIGMKSCFEYSEKDGEDSEWSAREWFVVRKAEIHVSDDQVLIPYLKMGVEAREQILGDAGLEDAPITRPDHPLVRYAEIFTHNFDLIAERKSVVSQLREVAKASIMAKFLLESGNVLPDSWFSLGDEAKPVCCLEVPQLWNDRCFSKISIKDGAIQSGKPAKMQGLYGGVDFGIDRFRLSAPSRVATSVVAGRAVLGRPASSLMSTSRAGLSVGPARQFARLSTPLSAQMSMAASKAGLGVPRVSAGLSMGVPQGVDLNLDKFNLSAPAQEGGRWGGSVQAKDGQLAIGSSFWPSLESGAAFSPEDANLLKDVFHPCLSDRRQEAEHFTPPPTSASYMQKLRQLVKGEQLVRRQRKEHFCSAYFNMNDAGLLFPSSWTSSFEIEHSADAAAALPLHARTDFAAEAGLLREALRFAAPVFDKCTEDGMRFRIYKIGSLQVRTLQEHAAEEAVAAVFSTRAPQTVAVAAASRGQASRGAKESEKIVKATEYVERAEGSARFKSYVVLETEEGHFIVVEKAAVGVVPWAENPAGLDDRNSLAKVIRSKDCRDSGMTVGVIKGVYVQELVKDSSSTRFAQAVFCHATGEAEVGGCCSGFSKPSWASSGLLYRK